jgi:hypothetical protein
MEDGHLAVAGRQPLRLQKERRHGRPSRMGERPTSGTGARDIDPIAVAFDGEAVVGL